MKEFAKEYIKFKRLDKNLTLRELCNKTSIDENYLCKIEIGTVDDITVSDAIKICDVLDIDIFKILDTNKDLLIFFRYFKDLNNSYRFCNA